jgi:hypothetical protein
MNKFENWFLKRIIKREVQQDYDHDKKHQALYQMIRDAHREEFTEDNEVTADDFLLEQFEKTQSQNLFGILRK